MLALLCLPLVQGAAQGLYYDPPSGLPMVNNAGMAQALLWLQAIAAFSPDDSLETCDQVNAHFLEGE